MTVEQTVGCVIEGNTIIGENRTTGTGIYVGDSLNSQIANNVVTNAGAHGINITTSPRATVQNNSVISPRGSYGIILTKGSDDSIVSGNLVYGVSAAPGAAALRISANTNRCVFTGNLVRRGANGGTVATSDSGSGIGNSCVNNDFTGFPSTTATISGPIRKTIPTDANVGTNLL